MTKLENKVNTRLPGEKSGEYGLKGARRAPQFSKRWFSSQQRTALRSCPLFCASGGLCHPRAVAAQAASERGRPRPGGPKALRPPCSTSRASSLGALAKNPPPAGFFNASRLRSPSGDLSKPTASLFGGWQFFACGPPSRKRLPYGAQLLFEQQPAFFAFLL